MKLTHLYVYIYPKIHEDNLTKILSYLTILAFINTLSLMDKEPLHIHFHSIHLVVRKKRKSNSNWLQQKRNLLALISEKCRNNLTCFPIWWRLQIASGFQVRIPLLFLVLPSGWLLYVKKKLSAARSDMNPHTTLSSRRCLHQQFLRKPQQTSVNK